MMLLWPQKWCLILSKEFNKEVHRDILDRKYFWGLMSDYDIWKRFLCIVGYTKYSFEAIIINQAIFESFYINLSINMNQSNHTDVFMIVAFIQNFASILAAFRVLCNCRKKTTYWPDHKLIFNHKWFL